MKANERMKEEGKEKEETFFRDGVEKSYCSRDGDIGWSQQILQTGVT